MVEDKMNELVAGIVMGALAIVAVIYISIFGKKSSGAIKNPFNNAHNADLPAPKIDVEKEIEVIKSEAEQDRPKIDLNPVDIVAVNAKLDQLRSKYKAGK